MQDIQNWIYGAVLPVLLTIAGWAANRTVAAVVKKLDEIIRELRKLNDNQVRHDEKLLAHAETLKDHEGRLRKLEN